MITKQTTVTSASISEPAATSKVAPCAEADKTHDDAFGGLLGTPSSLDQNKPQPEDDFTPDELPRYTSAGSRSVDRGTPAAQRGSDALTGEARSILRQEMARRSQLREGGAGADTQPRLTVGEQEKALQSWATANGHILDSDVFDARHREQGFTHGQEHEVVFLVKPSGEYCANKRNYNRIVGPLAMNKDYLEYFDRIDQHNRLFPDSAIHLDGFMEMSQGLAPVITQRFVESDGTTLARGQIEAHMDKIGFRRVAEKKFINRDGLVVDDLHDRNIVRDANGIVRVIDPVIRQETPPKDRESLPETSDDDLL